MKSIKTFRLFSNIKIGKKLIFSFIFIACLIGIIGYIGLSNMNVINQGKTRIYNDDLIPITLLATMEANTLSISRDMETIMYTQDDVEIIIIRDRVDTRAKENEKLLDQFKENDLSDRELELLGEYEQANKEYSISRSLAIDLAVKRNYVMARFQNEQGYIPRIKMERILAELRDINIDTAENNVKASEIAFGNSVRSMIAITLVGLISAILIGFVLERTSELKRINKTLQKEIAERGKYEKALKESENYYRAIFENAGTAMGIIEEDMTFSMINKEWEIIYGYKKEDLEGKTWPPLFSEEFRERMIHYHNLRRVRAQNIPNRYNSRIIDKAGKERDCLVVVDMIPGTRKSVVAIIDISEIKRVNRAYKANSAVNMAMLHAEDENELLNNVCRNIVDIGGYRLAWVGRLENDQDRTIVPIAFAGYEAGYLKAKDRKLRDPEKGYGPAGIAIKTGQPFICRNLESCIQESPRWWKEAIKRGYQAVIAIPLSAGKTEAWGALTIYSEKEDVFDEEEVKLLTEMAGDLAYGISSLRVRQEKELVAKELENSLSKMRRVLLQTVDALSNVLEERDPYTAGHQVRVAKLANEIAKRMNLSADQVEGITVAATLHDLGKVMVPGEILTKPGEISEIEDMLIKEHSKAGYDIIKDIEFPWPIAQAVLQHHEKIDGSGYPQGLTGDKITQEAKIMAVADVVEAMTSHRPYRAALGLDRALEEITRKKGKLYDPEVVDTCLEIFKENRKFLEPEDQGK